MSTEVVAAIDAGEARVSSAELRLAAAEANEVPLSHSTSGSVQERHAAVAAAEAALAQAQAALNAARAIHVPDPTDNDLAAAPPAPSNHIVDTVA